MPTRITKSSASWKIIGKLEGKLFSSKNKLNNLAQPKFKCITWLFFEVIRFSQSVCAYVRLYILPYTCDSLFYSGKFLRTNFSYLVLIAVVLKSVETGSPF